MQGQTSRALHSEGKTVVYTGDFSIHDSEILEGCNLNLLPKEPDVLISESTYGGRVRPPRGDDDRQVSATSREDNERTG